MEGDRDQLQHRDQGRVVMSLTDIMEVQKLKEIEMEKQNYFSLQSLISRGRKNNKQQDVMTQQQKQKIKGLSAALQACFSLRLKVENESFGYFFKYPCNPKRLGLPNYWRVIKRPMDLTTIKRKFIMGMYSQCSQFDQDMKLMFDNAFLFNKGNPKIVNNVKALLQFYQQGYQQIIFQVEKGTLSEIAERVSVYSNQKLNKLSEIELVRIFKDERLQQMGWFLSSLTNSKKKNLYSALCKKYTDIKLVQKEFQHLYLGTMNHEQLYDLLKLAKTMKQTDFDTSKLIRVPQRVGVHVADGVSVSHEQLQSSFEIQDESD